MSKTIIDKEIEDVSNTDNARTDFKDPEQFVFRSKKGLTRSVVEEISRMKDEPEWMLNFRLRAYDYFMNKPMPNWGGDLSTIDFDSTYYYARSADRIGRQNWSDVPENIRNTFDKLGIQEAERNFLGGVGAQYESEVVYHSLRGDLEKRGVVFLDMDSAIGKYPDIVKRYFGTIVPPNDNKFAALNSAVWSGGSFIYVPSGVEVDLPLQACYRINSRNLGQFERTLIVLESGAKLHYIEGCTSSISSSESFHAAVVEIIVKKGASLRYTTIQNWSKDVYNLGTVRAYAYEDASVEFIDGNLGGKLSMKYPAIYLVGPRAKGEVLSIALAGCGQHQDTGAKIIHLASDTTSRITSKSVSKNGGRTTYRGLLHVERGAKGVKSSVRCDALLVDEKSRTDTYPYNEINEETANVTHEA